MKPRPMNMRQPAKVEWRSYAVDEENPHDFAAELQDTLQELTDEGFTVINQMPRDGALIITAQRLQDGTLSPAELGALHQGELPRAKTLRKFSPPDNTAAGQRSNEVLYHFLDADGEAAQRSFPSVVEALRVVEEHLKGGTDIVPVSLMTVEMTRFDPEVFPSLLKAFSKELRASKPLE